MGIMRHFVKMDDEEIAARKSVGSVIKCRGSGPIFHCDANVPVSGNPLQTYKCETCRDNEFDIGKSRRKMCQGLILYWDGKSMDRCRRDIVRGTWFCKSHNKELPHCLYRENEVSDEQKLKYLLEDQQKKASRKRKRA